MLAIRPFIDMKIFVDFELATAFTKDVCVCDAYNFADDGIVTARDEVSVKVVSNTFADLRDRNFFKCHNFIGLKLVLYPLFFPCSCSAVELLA